MTFYHALNICDRYIKDSELRHILQSEGAHSQKGDLEGNNVRLEDYESRNLHRGAGGHLEWAPNLQCTGHQGGWRWESSLEKWYLVVRLAPHTSIGPQLLGLLFTEEGDGSRRYGFFQKSWREPRSSHYSWTCRVGGHNTCIRRLLGGSVS